MAKRKFMLKTTSNNAIVYISGEIPPLSLLISIVEDQDRLLLA
jgi:hypothetical protein